MSCGTAPEGDAEPLGRPCLCIEMALLGYGGHAINKTEHVRKREDAE